MANNQSPERCSTPLAIRDIKIKTTMTYDFPPIRIAKRKNSENSKCWQGCWETGSLTHC